MKILTVFCLSLCLLLLSACGTQTPTTAPPPTAAPTETPAPTLTPAPTPEPVEAETAEPEPYAAYRELVDKVAQGLRDGWSGVTVAELGISDVFTRDIALGWVLWDVNGDGVEELLFGKIPEGEETAPAYDVYTMVNGEIYHVAGGWEFNRWFVLGDGLLVNEVSSDGFGFDSRLAYGLFNGKLIPANRLVLQGEYVFLPFRPFSD